MFLAVVQFTLIFKGVAFKWSTKLDIIYPKVKFNNQKYKHNVTFRV